MAIVDFIGVSSSPYAANAYEDARAAVQAPISPKRHSHRIRAFRRNAGVPASPSLATLAADR
jgi:hypothetical protein